MANKNFEPPTDADLTDNYEFFEERCAYRDGYRDAVEKTNAPGLFEALKEIQNLTSGMDSGLLKAINETAKAALAKAETNS